MIQIVWDTTQNISFTEEAPFFSALAFSLLIGSAKMRSVPINSLLDWLMRPQGPELIKAKKTDENEKAPYQGLAILADWLSLLPCMRRVEAWLQTLRWELESFSSLSM